MPVHLHEITGCTTDTRASIGAVPDRKKKKKNKKKRSNISLGLLFI
jgi:hypothetical protein